MPPKTTNPKSKFQWETVGPRQELLRKYIESRAVTFAIGPAGTGKSLVSLFTALDLLDKTSRNGGVDKIVITRPLVTVASEEFGYLPGDLKEKTDPYMRPIYDLLKDSDHQRLQEFLNPTNSPIESHPVAMMRGITLKNVILIVDEAQNLVREQFYMILTRLGPNSKILFTGDPAQSDLKADRSGLMAAVNMFKDDPDVGVVEFSLDDIQRHDFVGRVIRKYAEAKR